MGLDTSHGAWHGAYGRFARFRNAIASAAGVPLGTDESGYTGPVLDWDQFTEANLQGEWDETPPDPLIVLLAHSDCDGEIRPAQAAPLADRLEGLLPDITNREHHTNARQFIAGLRAAVAADEPLDFH